MTASSILITLMPFPGSLLLEVGREFNRIKTEKKKKRGEKDRKLKCLMIQLQLDLSHDCTAVKACRDSAICNDLIAAGKDPGPDKNMGITDVSACITDSISGKIQGPGSNFNI